MYLSSLFFKNLLKAPQPVEPWNGKLDASKESNKICIQNNVADSHEDCLYLNVFTPKVDKKFLPVMFWIHGGMFSRGRGGPGIHGPEYFMDKDVLLVSINYRLGVLGKSWAYPRGGGYKK